MVVKIPIYIVNQYLKPRLYTNFEPVDPQWSRPSDSTFLSSNGSPLMEKYHAAANGKGKNNGFILKAPTTTNIYPYAFLPDFP